MTRVDEATTEADYIEFEFPDEASAERADQVVGFAAHVGATTRIVLADASRMDGVRDVLAKAGFSWEESESGITAADMWPEEPADEEEGPHGPVR